MALRLLLVDPDRDWLDSGMEYFTKNLYDVDIATNGKDAQLAIYNKKYFAVILNSATKEHSAYQVLKFIKRNHPSLKLIFVFDNAEQVLSDSDKAKLGIEESITKPFEISELSAILEGHQTIDDMMSVIEKRTGQSPEQELNAHDEQFTKVKIDEFFSSQAVLFDIFIKLGEGRFVKILHAGDTFSNDRLKKYKNEKGVEFLYFYTKDRRKYIQFTSFLTTKLNENKKVAITTKVNLLKNLSEKFVEESFVQGVKPQVVEQGKQVAENIYKIIDSNQDLYKVLRDYSDFDPNAFTHAFLVTLFSSAIIKQFDWQSKATIETTAMACMFHDIGKTKLPKELFTKKRSEMNESELATYKQHTVLGHEIVQSNKYLNNSVKQIILQHHENYDGTGFPSGVKSSKILTLANIVCLADDFVHIMTEEKVQPVIALKKILTDRSQIKHYNSKIVENFIKVFADPSKLPKV